MRVSAWGCALGLLCLSCGIEILAAQATAQQAAAFSRVVSPSDPQSYHIALNTLAACQPPVDPQTPICHQKITSATIAVLSQGLSLPIQVIRASDVSELDVARMPTHLLVLFPRGRPRPSDAFILKQLDPVWSKGWLVSVTRSDRSITPYCSRDSLSAELAEASARPIPDKAADAALSQAILTLGSQPGRRLLLVDIALARIKSTPLWASIATKLVDTVYVVDGGKFVSVPYAPTDLTESQAGINPGVWNANIRWRGQGIFHEVRLRSAMKHMISDGRYDYDIQFTAPNETTPLILRLPNQQNFLSSKIKAQLYTVANEAQPGSINMARIHSDRPLSLRTE